MIIKNEILQGCIRMQGQGMNSVWFVEKAENGRYYVTSTNGYNGHEGPGSPTLIMALKKANRLIKDEFEELKIH